ncbi:sporulation inhibitor of replication protein SirA [Bacillus sp. B1-b2]|uniref:sporulation inhibitor of replication protein SirA n=1 Tax=Bacillus sp. B1-b2 TaxID=2653201 RepID=UPI0012626768|nr:sporulation inhibitor of replication protein SirA [Bacillus sp. B1-b2]KAB7663588.1 sporulation inhibitor of replication protein SirA [Bacillus sp. B1-b2]
MRRYHLYLIKQDIAQHYSGRERMFFQLFSEYMKTADNLQKNIVKKQIEYITLPISKWSMENQLYNALNKNKTFQLEKDIFKIENGNLSRAILKIEYNHLVIEAEGYYDAESIFFEVIRKHEPSFLAIDIENERFGWLKPIKERNFI